MLWISRFPAFMIPKGSFTLCVTLWTQTLFAHIESDILNFFIQFFDVRLNFLQMHFAIVIDDFGLVENAIHVAFQFFIFMNFTVAKFFDCLYIYVYIFMNALRTGKIKQKRKKHMNAE